MSAIVSVEICRYMNVDVYAWANKLTGGIHTYIQHTHILNTAENEGQAN